MKFVLLMTILLDRQPFFFQAITVEFDAPQACERAGAAMEQQMYKVSPRFLITRQCFGKADGNVAK